MELSDKLTISNERTRGKGLEALFLALRFSVRIPCQAKKKTTR